MRTILLLLAFIGIAHGQAPADPTLPTDLPSPNGGAYTDPIALPTTNGTIANKTNDVGDVITYSPTYSAFNYGNPILYYEATNLPTGLSINATTGDITGTISDAVGSPLNVTIAKDLNGFGGNPDVDQTFTWTVNAGSPLANIKTNMLAWYDLTTDSTDSHASYDGADTGTPTFGDPATLDSSNYVDLPAGLLTALDSATDFTIMATVTTSSGQANQDMILASTSDRTSIRYHTGENAWKASAYAVESGTGSGVMAVSTTYQMGIQCEDAGGGNITVSYILDGVVGDPITAAAGLWPAYLRLGFDNANGTDYYNVAAWDRVLTAGEVTALDDETLNYADLP